MTSLPNEVYERIKSKLHPSPPDSWQPLTRASLGGIQILNLTEACYEVDPDFPFHPDSHPNLPLKDGRLSLMRFGICLVRLPTGTNVLLDAGVGPWIEEVEKCSGHPVPEKPPHALDKILQEELGLSLEDIHFVVHSHCHGDHVGWVGSFPNAVHVLHSKEYEFATYSGCPWKQDAVDRFEPLKEQGRLRLLDGDDDNNIPIDEEKCPQLTAVLCAGHTPGHIAVRIEGKTAEDEDMPPQVAFYIGDAMHFAHQVLDPDLVPLFDCCAWKSRPFLPMSNVETTWMPALRNNSKWHATTSCEARRKLLKRIAAEDALLISPHFSPPGMGTVEDAGGQFTYMAAAIE
ncbi:N-acyl homoserine lactonase AttM [Seminavis robusta]|uniref:N-acyl homoserine lactonase AttM n=1 Tax=Seminavis robusta TaxID=568900 RepID=A0A9N8DAZ4_9STRA|nr:N-acyl homoserine lactonase AttM [Seminavis robusta]|eukprot:Sro70_g039060.1 N-acyl homoserine lactonase AttM (345) ;mRNA; r:104171-105205